MLAGARVYREATRCGESPDNSDGADVSASTQSWAHSALRSFHREELGGDLSGLDSAVPEGLEGTDRLIAQFLLHGVRRQPELFHTRWAIDDRQAG